MAESDYTVADRFVRDADGNVVGEAGTGLEAGDKVQHTVQETPDADAAAFARTEGVSKPEYANYATALDAFAARDDIEGLAERRAREYGATFEAADFMRQEAYNADGTVASGSRPGTIYGDAPQGVLEGDLNDDGDTTDVGEPDAP